ncbi:MAG: OmpA/MotB family protein [Bacteroidales bacterium]
MKKTVYYLASFTLVASMLFTSCGPGKKLIRSEARVNMLQKDSAKTHNQLDDCNVQVKNLNDEKASLVNQNAMTQSDLKSLSSESKMTIADQAKRLKNFQDIIQSQKNVMDKLKNSIADALMNYKTDELSVYIKDGNVYVSLQEKLLFKSGSDIVDPKGKEALKTLAKVINSTKDITVMIEGHTDNVSIKTMQFKDNWDLSTARATSIVRILTIDYGFDAARINASGRGKFHPVKTNESAEGRAANRRTEIILSPDLKEIYKLLEQ